VWEQTKFVNVTKNATLVTTGLYIDEHGEKTDVFYINAKNVASYKEPFKYLECCFHDWLIWQTFKLGYTYFIT
jgi:hypothetical protein